jgi:glutathione S-transferase
MADSVYKLYGRKNAGSLAPQIALEEAGARYELLWVNKNPQELEAFRRVNPLGKIPVLVLPDGTVISESAAILIHLTDLYPTAGLAPPRATTAHARFLQWMTYLSSTLYETALRYYYGERYSNAGAAATEQVKTQALADYGRHLEFAQTALSPYVLGEQFSAADPYLYMLASWYPGDMAALHKRLPKLAQHVELVRRRPSTRKAEADHEPT